MNTMHLPPTDWFMLGRAVNYYMDEGYRYIEAPWLVNNRVQKLTFGGDSHVEAHYMGDLGRRTDVPDFLVASGEQSLLALDLSPGLYVTCTPCFRVEDDYDLMSRPHFMKVELFDNREQASANKMITDAKNFMGHYAEVELVETEEGYDLCVNGIEVGSYGVRKAGDLRWAYGTGLALPRFSAAAVLTKMGTLAFDAER